MAITSFDPSLLLSYYNAKLPIATSSAQSGNGQSAAVPPWDISLPKPAQEVADVSARSSDPYFNPNDANLIGSSTTSSSAQGASSELAALLNQTLSTSNSSTQATAVGQDNDKLFALYSALNRLDQITQMATRDGTVAGQLPGLNTSFQAGLSQIQSFVTNSTFNNLTVLSGTKTSSVQGTVIIPYAPFNYSGKGVIPDKSVFTPVAGVSATDQFTVSITKAGVNTDVPINLANVSGPLTIDNIDSYVNQQLSAAGFGTRLTRTQTGGSITDGTAMWGVQVNNSGSETVSFSSPQATAAVYIAGTSGAATDQQGKLVKLENVDGTPTSVFSTSVTPDTGTASAKATAVDANGNVFVVGQSTGSFGAQVNQGDQDVYLTKYDSTGQAQWTRLLGSADTANAFGLSVDSNGNAVIAGSVTGDLSPTSIGGGTDSFVAKYDKDGNQTWERQVAPLSNDQANSVSVDSTGNVYVGGQVSSSIASGQATAGGNDAYVTKLDAKGNVLYQRQFGTAGNDSAAQTAIASDGNLVVASVQSGHAILTKYDGSNGTAPALWQVDLGDLQGGAIGGLAVSGNQVYVSGTTTNTALTAGGAASVAQASSGGTDAFVFNLTDGGASATPDYVSYVGTNNSEQGGGVSVADGKIYLAGTTTGTFAGQTRNSVGTHNMFVAQLNADGTTNWTQQYGGLDGQSTGLSVAADSQGASVLDALGLKRGQIDINQSSTIDAQTTARAGDYFSLKITGQTGTRSAQITLEKGETLRSLATKINGALLFSGQAKALPTVGGQTLQISANPGVTIQISAGPKDFDALVGLGLKEQLLINGGSTSTSSTSSTSTPSTAAKSSSSSASSSATTGPQMIGLGINNLDLTSSADAAHAHVVMQAAMALIKQAYGNLNTPAQSANALPSIASAPQYLQNQLAGYQTALSWLQTVNTSSSSSQTTLL